MPGQPQRHVIGMRIEVLGRVCEPAKGGPGSRDRALRQRGRNKLSLCLHISAAFANGIVIEVKFIVAELVSQTILCQVGRQDGIQGTRAHLTGQRLADKLGVNRHQHGSHALEPAALSL